MDTIEETAADPATEPWTLPDGDLPEPELSAGAWEAPLPEVEDSTPSRSPIGMIVGGAGLGALIVGLGVFSAFGAIGLAVAAGATAVAAPAAAVGVADYRRRVKTGAWRPAGARKNAAGDARGRLRQAMTTATRTRKGPKLGGLGSMRSGKSGLGGGAGGGKSGGGLGRFAKGLKAGGGTGRKGGAGGLPKSAARSGGLTSGGRGRGTSRLGSAMRSLTGRSPRSGGGGLFGGGRHGGRNAQFGKKLTPRAQRREHRRVMRAMGSTGLGAWRAQRAERAKNRRQAVYARKDQRRQVRWERGDKRRHARAKWLRKRRKALVRRTRAVALFPLRASLRSARWTGRRTRQPFTAAWRRIVGSRAGGWFQRLRQIAWGAALRNVLARIAHEIRLLALRVPGWLWAPRPESHKPKHAAGRQPLRPDHHDDEVDSDAPAVARPGRRHRPTPAATPPAAGPAPAVQTPRARKGKHMTGVMHPAHEAAVDAFREAMGGWQPPDEGAYEEFESFFSSWQEMFNQMGDVVNALADRFRDETPIETAHDYLDEVATGLTVMGEAGAEVYDAWRTGNAPDIERAENPRPNEKQLNIV